MNTTIYCTEDELTILITEARSDRTLSVAWGSGGLLDTPDNAWAISRLNEIRGEE